MDQKETEKRQLEALAIYLNRKAQGDTAEEAASHTTYQRRQLDNIKKKFGVTSFDELLAKHDFQPHSWDHGWLKTDGASIHIKNKENLVTYDDIRDELVEAVKAHSPKYRKLERKKVKDGHLLVVSPTDIHIGRYSSESETGKRYNVEIAKETATKCLEGLLQKTSGFNIDKIFFLGGHDILNVDNPHNSTTAGTKQDNDRIWHENFIAARELCVHMLESLMTVADVHVMYNPSNHDYSSGFMLFDSLSSWFRNCKHLTFDASISHRKYATYGNSLIMSSHGDGAKEKDLVKLMAAEAKKEWADTDYRYIYLGHLHHRIAKDDIGATIEYTRTIAPACSWSDRNGYVNQPAMEAFVHSKTAGQIARITEYATSGNR